ncbi:THUMP domain-containing protein 2 isoform X2 [Eublepharis macularius]|uniref:THUMP domain-containing protein 2 isoform X2 n=1 Tax=Eublepharis macularius TaxID=481883 RepID=A0AA97JMN3_EUBMA|nr:THUMP domain-containing protein 2 isoform X2 [Eublepharis macularius]
MAEGAQLRLQPPKETTASCCAASSSAAYFCTAGRGMERFLMREVQARLGATQVEYVSGKVFFTTSAELSMLKKLKSAERLFLLLNKYPPLFISKNKGRIICDIQKLVNEDSRLWLDIVTVWKSLQGQEVKQDNVSPDSQKRKLEEEDSINNKRQKTDQFLETVSAKNQVKNQRRCDMSETDIDNALSEGKLFLEKSCEVIQEKCVESDSCFSFRVSCRCSGALAKVFPAQIFVHLNDIYSVIGIPVFRLPLASRAYIKTPGLRSTVAWAMASFAEIQAGAFVLDPTCGLGTILLEAATEWTNAHYLGTDISASQLQGAYSNIQAAGLMGKIDLLKASVTELPLPPESIDVVFADFPFGKKFKITNEMKLLPDVLQEIERVLCVGGTVVLLLSQELHKLINGGISSGPETENHNSAECEVVSLESDTQEKTGSPRIISPSAQHTGKEDISNTKSILGSLVLVESLEVSLGKTDAYMCKYKKPIAGLASMKS